MTTLEKTTQIYNCMHCKDKNWFIECECDDDDCNEIISMYNNRGKPRRFKNGHQNKGKNNGKWKGGRLLKNNYWILKRPNHINAAVDGYIPEHVYIYTEFHKCCMLPWGHIHHIDPVREGYCNNDINNLQGMTINQHMTLHHEFRREIICDRICFICGSNETYVDPDTGTSWWNEVEGKGFRCDKCYRNDPVIHERRLKYSKEYYLKKGKIKIKN